MARRGNTAVSNELSETRAKLAWSRKRPSLIAALTNKESFEEARALLLSSYETMLRARLCDEKAIILYKQNKAFFQIGVAGHEGIQVAAAPAFDKDIDCFFPYYRDMAFCAALGMTNEEFMLNCMNKQGDPNSHGRQLPMHYGSRSLNIPSQSSVTGSQFPQAAGVALAIKRKREPGIVYVSGGEGACAQGDFHESLNWATREKLPLVYVIENNAYAISVPLSEQFGAESIAAVTSGFESLKQFEVDGTDFFASYDSMQAACEWARSGNGPVLVEAHVVRLQSHSISDNQLKYRSEEEISEEKKRCPIIKLRQYLVMNSICSKDHLSAIEEKVRKEVDAAAAWAELQPDPDPLKVMNNIYSDTPEPLEGKPDGEDVFFIDAVNKALHEEMESNKNVHILGEDVAREKGGVFGATSSLTEDFGDDRCFNSPLAESSIVGVAIGMALEGLKPVAEIQFGDYSWYAMMQLRDELAMMRYRSGGDSACPAVIRIPVGGYIHGGPYHSQNIEATFAHFPGLKIAFPSNATDAYGLLKSSIRGKDPVLFLEHKGLYRQAHAKGPAGGKDFLVPFGKARVARDGSDATIVTWGALLHKSLTAAKEAEKRGYSVEVIDLRTIVPLDIETVFSSVDKTSRILIVHEDSLFMGFGAEIAAQIADKCFEKLDAPVKRLGMKDVPAVPHSAVLEDAVLPQEHDVIAALEELLGY